MESAENSGWLQKRGPDPRYGWEKRYCALLDNSFAYYEDESATSRKGEVALTGASGLFFFNSDACPGDGQKYRKDHPWGFCIDPDGFMGGKKRNFYYFDAGDSNNLDSWKAAFERVIERLSATEDFKVGERYQADNQLLLRAGEDLDSEAIMDVMPGAFLTIKAFGVNNKRRGHITLEEGGQEGWISVATKHGEKLIAKVQENKRAKSARLTVTHGSMSSSESAALTKAILESSRAGNVDQIVEAVAARTAAGLKPNLNCCDIRGKTGMIYAAAFGHKNVIEYFLAQADVEVNALDDTKKTALHHVCKRARTHRDSKLNDDASHGELVTMLVKAGADIEARDHNGCTALMFAVANGDAVTTKALLDSGANPEVTDYEGHKPVDYAEQFGHPELITLLEGEEAWSSSDEEKVVEAATSGGGSDSPKKKNSTLPPVPEDENITDSVSTAPTTTDEKASKAKEPKGEAKKKAKKKAKAKAKKDDDDSSASQSVSASSTPSSPAAKKPKGKAKSKGKVKVEKVIGAGAQEMLETQEMAKSGAAQSIAVEVLDKGVDEKQKAISKAEQKLAAVLNTTSAKELEQAIKTAKDAGVSEDKMEPARQALSNLQGRAGARDRLATAVANKDVDELKSAIDAAEKQGVGDKEIAEAKKVLAVEEPKAVARQALKDASNSGVMDDLKKAIEEAEKLKLPKDEVAPFKEMLAGAESKDKAIKALEDAIASKDVAALKFQIKSAKGLGIDTSKAEQVLKEEEPKQKAREKLEEVVAGGNVEAIKAAIAEGKKVGLADEDFVDAEEVIAKEAKKLQLMVAVNSVMEETMTVNKNSIDELRAAKQKLSEAIQEAKDLGCDEKSLVEAELRRRKLHNGIEDLKGSIRVFNRIRPLSKKEKERGDTNCTKQIDSISVEILDENGKADKNCKFAFDACFMPGTQEEVFEDCRDLIQSAVDGYNVTLFAYGQSGAGKTFTMYGEKGMEGVAPRTITEVYRVIQEQGDRFTFTVMGSMLELYRSDLVDLLVKGSKESAKGKLKVRADKSGMVTVEHLTEQQCNNVKELTELLAKGDKNRAVSATGLNEASSRSHSVLTIKIISVNKETQEMLKGKILICDLAGSERLGKSQTTGDAQKESIEINKSLTALGDVIEALTKGSKQIPYRNHKLTELMQDALGGTAKTLMFVNCSPANTNREETINSLKYATRAKQITNKTGKNKGNE